MITLIILVFIVVMGFMLYQLDKAVMSISEFLGEIAMEKEIEDEDLEAEINIICLKNINNFLDKQHAK